MTFDLYQVDAFTDQIFKGNPAAVCPLEEWLADGLMQQIAMENNLSETAFFVEQEGGFRLRWFTPKTEVDLCGHATLASAHVLFQHLAFNEQEISFLTKSGTLTVTREEDGWYVMNFPVAVYDREAPPLDLYHALGGEIADEVYKGDDYMLVLDKAEKVRQLTPDFELMNRVDARGVIVTAPGADCDFISRFFAPAAGVNEDPVTGSAHTMLAPYWGKRLGKKELIAQQVSTRGGTLKCKLLENDRVEISGQAITYLQGKIEMPKKI